MTLNQDGVNLMMRSFIPRAFWRKAKGWLFSSTALRASATFEWGELITAGSSTGVARLERLGVGNMEEEGNLY